MSPLAPVASIMGGLAHIHSHQVAAPWPSFCRFWLIVTHSYILPWKMTLTGRNPHLEDAQRTARFPTEVMLTQCLSDVWVQCPASFPGAGKTCDTTNALEILVGSGGGSILWANYPTWSWAGKPGTWQTPKPSQSKLERKSLWSQHCGDLNHVHSQLLSQCSVSLLRFLLAALVSASSDLLLQRILLQRLLSPRSGLFSLEALKEGLQANSGFPRRSDIFLTTVGYSFWKF